MAKKEANDTVEAFVLRDCQFGKAGEVVNLSKEDAKIGADVGALDLHPDSIKHAKKQAV